LPSVRSFLGGIFDYDAKHERLEEVSRELESSEVWNEPERAQALGKERASLEAVVKTIDDMDSGLEDVEGLLELAIEEEDEDTFNETTKELDYLESRLAELEFRRMFSGPQDASNCYLDIQSGSGGTEAQDWANMVLRMYLRWGEAHGFSPELMEVTDGDVAGIKGATIKFTGEYAFGWLRTETGVHRLVRKSPFDSSGRRHTSFCSVFVYPEIDDDITIDINPADLRIDVYQAKLFELEMHKQNAEKQAAEDAKSDIGWGSQIRSYVLDDSRIKDLRTSVETRNTQAVLDGDLDKFIEASLKSGL